MKSLAYIRVYETHRLMRLSRLCLFRDRRETHDLRPHQCGLNRLFYLGSKDGR